MWPQPEPGGSPRPPAYSFPQDIVSRENGGPICRADLFPTSARGVGRNLSKKVIGVEEGAQNRGWCSRVLVLPCVPQALSGAWVSHLSNKELPEMMAEFVLLLQHFVALQVPLRQPAGWVPEDGHSPRTEALRLEQSWGHTRPTQGEVASAQQGRKREKRGSKELLLTTCHMPGLICLITFASSSVLALLSPI